MNKIEEKIQLTENKILESKIEEQANQLITEMKKILDKPLIKNTKNSGIHYA